MHGCGDIKIQSEKLTQSPITERCARKIINNEQQELNIYPKHI